MQTITDFADQAVILPLVLVVLGTLLWLRWHRAAWAWLGVTGGTLLTMLCLKLVFAACGPGPGGGGLADPSGHTAAAAAVYGGAVGLLARGTVARSLSLPGDHRQPHGLTQAGLAAVLLAVLIGTSRVVLGMHTVPDVIAGGVIGVGSTLLLARLAGPPPPAPAWRRRLLAPLVAVPLLLHGFHLNAEPRIRAAATFWPLTACQRPSAQALASPTGQTMTHTAFTPYHRAWNRTTQTTSMATLQRQSGELWGDVPHNGGAFRCVQAHGGVPRPSGARGMDFATRIAPTAGTGTPFEARWLYCDPGVPKCSPGLSVARA